MEDSELVMRSKRSVMHAIGMLRRLEANPSDMNLLEEMQRTLIGRLRSNERRARALKNQLNSWKSQLKSTRPTRELALLLKARITAVEATIASYKYMSFIWRSFGDGIAFTYLDRYSLKHVFYETSAYVPKQDAGTISGKAGFQNEWRTAQQFIRRGIPAVLADITNTVRHGDVCILIGPDPIAIEVKSSSNTNLRVERQRNSLKALGDFLTRDEARNFRGVPHVTRVALSEEGSDHASSMALCIVDSRSKTLGIRHPEPGLTYVCINNETFSPEGLNDLFESVGDHKVLCLLNEEKRERTWMPHYPFTLLIREPRDLLEFIAGKITLMVVIDLEVLRDQFAEQGLKMVYSTDGNWALWLSSGKDDGVTAVSRQLFGRLFLELQSLEWFARMQIEQSNKIRDQLASTAQQSDTATQVESDGWQGPVPSWVNELFDSGELIVSVAARATLGLPAI